MYVYYEYRMVCGCYTGLGYDDSYGPRVVAKKFRTLQEAKEFENELTKLLKLTDNDQADDYLSSELEMSLTVDDDFKILGTFKITEERVQ